MNYISTQLVSDLPKEIHIGWDWRKKEINVKQSPLINAQELQQISHPNRRGEYIQSRFLLEQILHKIYGSAAQVSINKNAQGKPELETPMGCKKLSFSHSAEMIACAVSDKLDIGLDVEPANRTVSKVVLERLLNDEEKGRLMHLPAIKLWTIKEAAVKCWGVGLGGGVQQFNIVEESENNFVIHLEEQRALRVLTFSIESYQAAIAWEHP